MWLQCARKMKLVPDEAPGIQTLPKPEHERATNTDVQEQMRFEKISIERKIRYQ